jgi:hypothetical protein
MKSKKIKKIIDNNMYIFDHFLIPDMGGWPLCPKANDIDSQAMKDLFYLQAFKLDTRGRISFEKKKLPMEVLSAYIELKMEELRQDFDFKIELIKSNFEILRKNNIDFYKNCGKLFL